MMSERDDTPIELEVNGVSRAVPGRGDKTLLTALRDDLGLTGAKRGCNQGVCGACTVLVDGEPMRACLSLAANCAGHSVTTVEGLSHNGALTPIQQALIDANAVQCGFCTSGMIMTAHAFLRRNTAPTADEVRTALSGNLCRCSGYRKIVDAVLLAAGTDAAPGEPA